MEITKSINRYKPLYKIINSLLKSFLFLNRRINKVFAHKDGNIVVISLHRLGDSVFTIPAIREIQKFYSKKIIVFCYPEAVPIYKLKLANIDFCQIDHKNFYFHDRIANFNARKKLKLLKPEIIFDLTGVMTSATLIFNSRAKEIIGMNREQFRTIYDYYVPVRRTPHLIDRYLDAINVKIPIINRAQIKNFPIDKNPDGKILIHPFGGWKAKEWNLRKFINLADGLKDEYNVCLIAPVNRIPDDVIYAANKQKIDIVQTQSVQELIIYIKECSFFIGNDSGPLYIASLLGKPTFTIYGPTNPVFSHPIGKHHNYINKVLKCSPQNDEQYCFTTGGQAGCPAFQCMDSLDFEKVYFNLLPFIKNYCTPKY